MIEPMTLFVSHRMERLVDSLAEQLSTSRSPCEKVDVILPGLINKQWLMVSLIQRFPNHAITSIRFLSWREALLHHDCINNLELQLALQKIFASDVASSDPLAPFIAWSKEKGPRQLALLIRRLSEQMIEAGFYQMNPKEPWQCSLLERLAAWQFPIQSYTNAKPTAQQIHCFCVDEMPQAAWNFFLKSKCCVYLFSPCLMFWEDLLTNAQRRSCLRKKVSVSSIDAMENYLQDTHPLLANWGRQGRVTIRLLEALEIHEVYDQNEESLESVHEKFQSNHLSLLQIIQNDLLFLRTLGSVPPQKKNVRESSISVIAAGSSLLREVQILKDQIIHEMAEAKEKISYSEILILAPDIRPYEPLIQFVFGDLPIRIAPVPILPHNPSMQAVLLFFSLSDRRFEVDAILELFENKAFQAKHQVTAGDLEWIRTWLKEAKVREGWQPGLGGWLDGLQRILSGLVYLLPEDDPLPRVKSIDWGQADLLNRFLELIQELQRRAELLNASHERTLEEWMQQIKDTIEFLIEPEVEILGRFERKLADASIHFPLDRFPFNVLRLDWEDDCKRASSVYQGHLLEAIQFSSLIPGAIRPARFLFLLGMDSGSFPHLDSKSTLDWEHVKPESADQDRYLLLQALFAARERLTISYRHLSSEDGKIVEPALPVQELLHLIETFYPGQEIRPTIHPTLACDPHYFQQDGLLRSYSLEAFQAATVTEAPSVFWPRCITKADVRVFDLADLMLLARHPWSYFLQRKLGIYLKNETLFSEKRLDDFTLAPFVEQKWLKRALKMPIDEVIAQYSEELPPKAFGAWAQAQLRKKANEWHDYLRKWGINKNEIYSVRFSKHCKERTTSCDHIDAPPIRIETDKGWVEIVGELDLVTPAGLLSAHESNFFNTLRNWPSLLAAMTLFSSSPSLLSLKKGTIKTWKTVDGEESMRRWMDYTFRAGESLSPLIDPWADLFLLKGKEEWKQAARRSLMKENDSAIRWVLERSQPLPLDSIWEEWGSYLSETFAGLKDHAAL